MAPSKDAWGRPAGGLAGPGFPDKGTPVARRARKARGLSETARLPKEICMTKLGPVRSLLRVGALCIAVATFFPGPSPAAARPAGGHHFAPRYATIRWSYARAAHKVPHRLLAAAFAARRADHTLVAAAFSVRRCILNHPHYRRRCRLRQAALQRDGRRLRRAQLWLAA